MSKESRILLLVTIVSTIALAGLQYYLHDQTMKVAMISAQNVYKAMQINASNANNPVEEETATASASPSADPAEETASPSATARARATVRPTATPEPTEEE